MTYEVETTDIFDHWLESLRDKKAAVRIMSRIPRLQAGNFGDHKNIDARLSELRFFFGPGYRVYYTIKGNKVILLLCGGDKTTQEKDIKLAKQIIKALE